MPGIERISRPKSDGGVHLEPNKKGLIMDAKDFQAATDRQNHVNTAHNKIDDDISSVPTIAAIAYVVITCSTVSVFLYLIGAI